MGDVAAQLGVAPATVRSWGRRYGLVPASRTEGGHRRYAPHEVATLRAMQELVGTGMSPAEAARRALAGAGVPRPEHAQHPARPAVRRSRPGGPGGRVLAVPGGGPQARGLARSASRLDAEAATGQLRDLLVKRGAVETWSDVILPVLLAIGERWMTSPNGVAIEHVLSEATMDAVRSYCLFLPAPAPGRPVLLACTPEEAHTLPLHILRAALTEKRVATLMLGGRVPFEALSATARQTGARRVFLWRSPCETPGTSDPTEGWVPATVVGGLGWQGFPLPDDTYWVRDLPAAVRVLTAA